MSISSGQVQAECFRVVPDTVFQFKKSTSKCDGSAPELSQVGGLDNIIEELEEIITNVTSSKNIFPGKIANFGHVYFSKLFYSIRTVTNERCFASWCSRDGQVHAGHCPGPLVQIEFHYDPSRRNFQQILWRD